MLEKQIVTLKVATAYVVQLEPASVQVYYLALDKAV